MNDNRAKRTREILDQLSVVLTEYKNNLESSQCHQENCNYPRYYIIRKIELLNNDLKSIVRKVEWPV